MKILEITYTLSSGGGERMIVDLCNQYSKKESDEIYLLMTNTDKIKKNIHFLPDLDKRVKVFCTQAQSGFALKSFWGVIQTIRKIKPDIVHAHICDEALLFLPALIFPRIRFISTFHTTVERSVSLKKIKVLYRWMFYTDRIIPCVISESCKKTYQDFFHLNNCVLIINGRGELPFTKYAENVKQEIANYKSKISGPVFIFVGRDNPVKNTKLLFQTFHKLETEGIGFQLLVVGSGHKEHYSQYESQQIHIVGEKSNVGDYLRCSDFFVLTSHREGLPMSLLEAMSCGVIPVTTPAGGVVDVVRDGDNGFMSNDTENSKEFYQLVKRAIKNQNTISKEKLIAEYHNKYSIEVNAQNYYSLYEKYLFKK